MKENDVRKALVEFLKKQGWKVKRLSVYEHPTDNAITAELYRILPKETKK